MLNFEKKIHIGILGAMQEEVNSLVDKLVDIKEFKFGDLKIFNGIWRPNKNTYNSASIHVSVAWSGWGKTSASRAVTRILSTKLIDIPIDMIIFTGVAGATSSLLNQWDVVIADKIYQHDFDARPFFEEFYIPALKTKYLVPQENINQKAKEVLKKKIEVDKTPFNKIYNGAIATGDKFIQSKSFIKNFSKKIDNLLAVEMEGAAVAQVCMQEEIPWLILRVISDSADEKASESFEKFLEKYNKASSILIEYLLFDILKENYEIS